MTRLENPLLAIRWCLNVTIMSYDTNEGSAIEVEPFARRKRSLMEVTLMQMYWRLYLTLPPISGLHSCMNHPQQKFSMPQISFAYTGLQFVTHSGPAFYIYHYTFISDNIPDSIDLEFDSRRRQAYSRWCYAPALSLRFQSQHSPQMRNIELNKAWTLGLWKSGRRRE